MTEPLDYAELRQEAKEIDERITDIWFAITDKDIAPRDAELEGKLNLFMRMSDNVLSYLDDKIKESK